MKTKNLLVTANKWSLKAIWYRLRGYEVKTGQELWDDSAITTVSGKSGSNILNIIGDEEGRFFTGLASLHKD